DYAIWQKSSAHQILKQERYWAEKLQHELPPLELPRMQDKDSVDIRPAAVELLHTDEALYQRIKQFTTAEGVSDYMFLLSVYYILLSRLTGNTDIVIGSDVVGRTHPALKHVAGSFINILPLRISINSSDTYMSLLQQVRNTVLEAFDNQDFQYDRMCQLAGRPLADVHFAFVNFFESTVELDGLQFIPVSTETAKTTQYEFKIEVVEQEDGFILQFIYSTALYDAGTIEAFVTYYRNIMQAVLHDPLSTIESISI
ncbi:MAG TPA: condensation domain-containing protein, partial [Chitinophagaceae bacterium]|nr:condensation domain-containing protein [Chitinophagaceae bacterium]